MSAYLRNLVARTLGAADVVRPRLTPLFLGSGGKAGVENDSAITHLHASHASEARPELRTQRRDDRREQRPAALTAHDAPRELRHNALDVPDGKVSSPAPRDSHDDAKRAARNVPNEAAAGGNACADDAVAHADRESVREIRLEARDNRHASPRGEATAAQSPASSLAPAPAHDHSSPATAERRLVDDTVVGPLPTLKRNGSVRDPASVHDVPRRAEPSANTQPAYFAPRTRAAQRETSSAEGAARGEETVINVTIGRIEVRAPAATPKPPAGGSQPAPAPRAELDAYLRSRSTTSR
ncbi:MAG: hypothetical protein ACLPSH_10070 [Vulcanimicrobiaceae bacterium]